MQNKKPKKTRKYSAGEIIEEIVAVIAFAGTGLLMGYIFAMWAMA